MVASLRPHRQPWSAWNCAEVAACAKALDAGASLTDLEFYTVGRKTGEFFAPCDNCETWLPGSPQ